MINYNSVYVVFLAFLIAGVFTVSMMDVREDGACKRSTTGSIMVQQPDSQSFKEAEFCIWVWL